MQHTFNKKTADEITKTGSDLARLSKFVHDGYEHGTLVEALYETLKATLSGEAKSIQEALDRGAAEWYK